MKRNDAVFFAISLIYVLITILVVRCFNEDDFNNNFVSKLSENEQTNIEPHSRTFGEEKALLRARSVERRRNEIQHP